MVVSRWAGGVWGGVEVGEAEGFVIVVGQNMGAAAASSFALVLCSMGSP